MRILLAEDDPNISTIAQLSLEKIGGHQVVVRADGQATLDVALREPFDLFIFDGMMPYKSGLEVAYELQSASVVGTPVIFLSAKTDQRDVSEFLRLGIGHIVKPFDPQKLCMQIDELLAKAARQAVRP